MTLSNQCVEHGIPLYRLVTDGVTTGEWQIDQKVFLRPEKAALKFYETLGWAGTFCEGGPIILALHSLSLDWLAEQNTLGGHDAETRYLAGQLQLENARIHGFLSSIRNTDFTSALGNFEKIYSNVSVHSRYPSVSKEFISVLLRKHKSTLIKVAEGLAQDPYRFAKGWPDLTLVKGDILKFVEVKTTDTLTDTQIDIIENFVTPLGLDYCVTRLSHAD